MTRRLVTVFAASLVSSYLADTARAGSAVGPIVVITKTVAIGPSADCAATQLVTVVQGTPVTYCYRLHNVGDIVIITKTVQDSDLGCVLLNDTEPLAPGASRVVTQTAVPCLSTTSIATVTGQTAAEPNFITDTATASVVVEDAMAAVALDKTVTTGTCPGLEKITVTPGTNVNYCYRISNSGNITLTTHDLLDSELGPILSGVTLELGPGQSTPEIPEPAVINATTTNVATVTSAFTVTCGETMLPCGEDSSLPQVAIITGTASATDMAEVAVVTATPTSTPTSTSTMVPPDTATPTPTATQTGTPTRTPTAQAPETGDQCGDGRDNDNDGAIDCRDPSCRGSAPCVTGAPLLGNIGLALLAILLCAGGALSLSARRRGG